MGNPRESMEWFECVKLLVYGTHRKDVYGWPGVLEVGGTRGIITETALAVRN